jgi:hypothetical protein
LRITPFLVLNMARLGAAFASRTMTSLLESPDAVILRDREGSSHPVYLIPTGAQRPLPAAR